jgi:spermidine/putrescine transport system ATP-binding protein
MHRVNHVPNDRASMGEHIVLTEITKKFGTLSAVDNVSVSIGKGEFFSFLGPSGCGKTTVLRLISGFADPTAGSIRIAGVDMRNIGPNERPTALIFQNLALFPLMKVWENVAFGLEVRGIPKSERRRRAEELLSLVELHGVADKNPGQLSGGQRQRVAIARALAVEPQVLLLDEPLSALDLKLRQYMRAELRKIQRRTGVTFIYITHDQGEALTMSDRVAVMCRGKIEQIAPPAELYNSPATAFVASFVGENNFFRGVVEDVVGTKAAVRTASGTFRGRNQHGLKKGDDAILFVRPEHMRVVADSNSLGNTVNTTFDHADFEGNFTIVHFVDDTGRAVAVQMSDNLAIDRQISGQPALLGFSSDQALILKAGDLARE